MLSRAACRAAEMLDTSFVRPDEEVDGGTEAVSREESPAERDGVLLRLAATELDCLRPASS